MKKITWLFLLFLVLFIQIQTAFAWSIVPFAKNKIATTYTAVGANKKVVFNLMSKKSCKKLGLKEYGLYMSDGTKVISNDLKDYKSGKSYKKSIDLSKYMKFGETYYVEATYYADGETVTDTSPKVKFD